jgi:uncharacterized protein (DUF924 family)
MSKPEDVLSFWFETPTDTPDALKGQMRRWYRGGAEMDQAIRERFLADVERALHDELEEWARTPRGRLALVLLLDQFTRSLFRDTPRAFAGDLRAQALARDGFDRGDDRALSIAERNFLMMPFVHAEDLAMQARGIAEIDRLVADAPAELRPIYAMGVEQSRKYHDVIRRFGRFPHRNQALGRPSTQEEEEFLRDWKEKQAPSGSKSL